MTVLVKPDLFRVLAFMQATESIYAAYHIEQLPDGRWQVTAYDERPGQ